jgi:integrase
MGVYTRSDSPFYWIWLEGAPPARARLNTKVPIGATTDLRRENRVLAERIYSALMGDRARDRFHLPATTEDRTFADHRAWYATHVTAKKRGAVRERSMLRQLGRFFDAYALAAIDVELREEWRTWRADDVGAATINREDEVLKHLLNLAVPKYLARNPIARAPRLRAEDVETRILTQDEEGKLLTAARGRLELAAVLAGLDGLMRRGSVAALKRAQDHGRYLTLLNAKAGMYKVPVSVRLRRALDRLRATLDDDEVAYFAALGPRVDVALSHLFTTLCARADVVTGRARGGVTFHSLRHTGASRMLAAGVDIKTVMRIGGWKNLKTLERYLHPTDEASQQAVNAIATPVGQPIRQKSAQTGRKARR